MTYRCVRVYSNGDRVVKILDADETGHLSDDKIRSLSDELKQTCVADAVPPIPR